MARAKVFKAYLIKAIDLRLDSIEDEREEKRIALRNKPLGWFERRFGRDISDELEIIGFQYADQEFRLKEMRELCLLTHEDFVLINQDDAANIGFDVWWLACGQ